MENTSSEEEKSHLPRVLRLKILRQDKQNCEGLLYCYLKLSGILTPLIQRAYDIQHRDFGKETKLHALCSGYPPNSIAFAGITFFFHQSFLKK